MRNSLVHSRTHTAQAVLENTMSGQVLPGLPTELLKGNYGRPRRN